MAGEDRGQTTLLMDWLQAEIRKVTFLQAMRLLRLVHRRQTEGKIEEQSFGSCLHIRPDLGLDFPGSDITEMKPVSADPLRFLMTVTFMGLYGVSSPLPTFYTEDLIEERREDRSITRDFLDIFHFRLYPLLYRIWLKYQLVLRVVEEKDAKALQLLYDLLGLGTSELQDAIGHSENFLQYVGLFTNFPRSANGLRTLLNDRYGETSFTIHQCQVRVAPIPEDQLCRLGVSGHRLGDNALLGTYLPDRMCSFQIALGPVSSKVLHNFLPDQANFLDLKKTISFYLDQPLTWDLKISIPSSELQTARLGASRWSRLGWNTWIFSRRPEETPFSVVFPEACD